MIRLTLGSNLNPGGGGGGTKPSNKPSLQ